MSPKISNQVVLESTIKFDFLLFLIFLFSRVPPWSLDVELVVFILLATQARLGLVEKKMAEEDSAILRFRRAGPESL